MEVLSLGIGSWIHRFSGMNTLWLMEKYAPVWQRLGLSALFPFLGEYQ